MNSSNATIKVPASSNSHDTLTDVGLGTPLGVIAIGSLLRAPWDGRRANKFIKLSRGMMVSSAPVHDGLVRFQQTHVESTPHTPGRTRYSQADTGVDAGRADVDSTNMPMYTSLSGLRRVKLVMWRVFLSLEIRTTHSGKKQPGPQVNHTYDRIDEIKCSHTYSLRTSQHFSAESA